MRDKALRAWERAGIDPSRITERDAYILTHGIDHRAQRRAIPLYAWLRAYDSTPSRVRIRIAITYDGAVREGIEIIQEKGTTEVVLCPWASDREAEIITEAFVAWLDHLRRVPLLNDTERRALIVSYIEAHPGCTAGEVTRALTGRGMAKATMQRCLNSLIGDGIVDVTVAQTANRCSCHRLTLHEESP